MGIKIENNAASTLATSVGTSDVSLSLATGGGAKFPALGAGDYFWATLVSEFDPTYMEIVKVTARSTDTLTVVRAQESTTAKTFQAGDKFEMRITAQTMRDYADAANITGTISISQGGTGGTTASAARTNLGLAIGSNVQAWDADLDAIAALAGTSGLLKKTGTNTWSLDSSAYLTGNQTITLSGDATGSGATSIAVTLANSGVTAGTYTKFTVDSKGRVTLGATLTSADLPTYTGTLTSGQVTNALTYTPENIANKGVASGYASLDASGKVPAVQLPSYVDDVVEAANLASFPGTGEAGKIYVAIDSNKTYRWSGSAYVEISASPGTTDAVPEGSSNLYFTTARARAAISASGSLAYNSSTGVLSFTDAVTSVAGKTGAVTVTSSDVGLGNVENKSSATIRGEITSGNVTTALGYTPYNSTNPSGYISGITSGMVTGALGYTPYNSTNPSGFITSSFSGFMLRSTSAQGNPSANFVSSAYRFDPNANNPTNEHYAVLTYGNESNVVGQLATHFQSGQTFTRAYNSSWSSWRTQLDSGNYNSYSPTLTGGGASGTWGINVTGNAGSASSVAWTNVSGRPTAVSSFTNDSGYITGITSGMVTSALGYTPPQPNGTGASGTWGISITGNAATAYGLSVHAGRNNEVNKVVRTDQFGYIQAGWINTTSGDNGTTAIDRVYASSDGYIRYYTPANFRAVLDVPTRSGGSASGTWGINITGNAATVSSITSGQVTGALGYTPYNSSNPSGYITSSISSNFSTTGRLIAGALQFDSYATWVGGGAGGAAIVNSSEGVYQALMIVGNSSAGGSRRVRVWDELYVMGSVAQVNGNQILHAGNYSGYALPLSGGTLTGTTYFSGANGGLQANYTGGVSFYGNEINAGALGTAGSLYVGNRDTNEVYIKGSVAIRAGNYNSYSPTLTGGGASGTWSINITGSAGSASSASSVPASGITGQTGMWTSAARPGPYRLYRNEDNSAYNVQTTWSPDRSGYWSLRGYYNDSYHAPCYVAYSGYADSAGSASSVSSITSGQVTGALGFTPVQQGGGSGQGTNKVYIGWRGGDLGLQVDNTNFGGTWPISISGNAASATGGLTTSNYSSYAVPISGTTMTGPIAFTSNVLVQGVAGGGSRGYLYNDTSAFGFLTYNGGWACYVPYGTNNWQVNGSITASGNITAYSDEAFKKDWQPIASGFVERLAQLKSGTYTRIDTDQRHAGVSAQKIREFLPEVVEQDHKGNLTLAYGNAAMVSAVELAKEIVELKKELATIKYQLQRGE